MLRFVRLFAAIVSCAGLLSLSAVVAQASTSGAHFMRDTSASVNDSGGLVVNIDEAGVGNQDVNYTLTANATATYACINGGGNHPKAANKETFQNALTASGKFSPINGRIMATLTSGPVSADGFSCPSGQTLVLANVSYDNIVLTDTTNGVTDNLGSASRVFFAV